MKIVFLVVDYVPHQVLSIKTLIKNHGARVEAFHVGRFVKTVPALQNFMSHHYNTMKREEILVKIRNFNPDLVVTAGWMIPEYNWICKRIKRETNIPVVALSDTPWYGTFKQKINSVIAPFHVKKAFTHLWVAGIRQYDYAHKLGFKNEQIIFNALSADTNIFLKVDIEGKSAAYPKNFLFIGRYTEEKGLKNLIEAWSSIDNRKGWTFTLIGAGHMKSELVENGNFIVKDYATQSDLLNEMQQAGCFVLPSLHEPWGLVLHEAAAAGLPILCTETCGAAPYFVLDNYNGYRVCNDDIRDLKNKLLSIIKLKNVELLKFSENSRKLSAKISPELLAANLMSIYNAETK